MVFLMNKISKFFIFLMIAIFWIKLSAGNKIYSKVLVSPAPSILVSISPIPTPTGQYSNAPFIL